MVEFPYRNGYPAVEVEVRLPAEQRGQLAEAGISLGGERGWGLIDTGSFRSGFDMVAAGRAGVRQLGWQSLRRHAGPGTYEVPLLDGDIVVPGLKSLRVEQGLGLELHHLGFIALIGRDFLDGLHLVCDGCGTKTRLELC